MTTEPQSILVSVVTERALMRESIARLLETFPGFAAVPTAPADLADDTVADAYLIDESTAQTLDGAAAGKTIVILATNGEGLARQLTRKLGAAGCVGMQVAPERLHTVLTQACEGSPIARHRGTDPDALPLGLTLREVDILRHLAAGRKGRDVAEALDLSPNTVRTHIQNLMMKLGAATRIEAVVAARRLGLLNESGPENGTQG